MRMRRIRRGGFVRWGWRESKNAVEGDLRHQEFNAKIKEKYPDATIQCECYLRDASGKSVKDPVTSERRRVDTVVIKDGKAQTFEVTSPTADKTKQLRKETKIRAEGGAFIRNRETREIVPVSGISEIVRIP